MEIKVKKPVMFLSIFVIVVAVDAAFSGITLGRDLILSWIIILGIPLELVAILFLMPTLRLYFSEKGLRRYWKIGIGKYILWEDNRFSLQWNNVSKVFSAFPLWVPLRMIGIGGRTNRRYLVFYVGFVTTQTKESILYIATHVKKEVISNDVKKLVKKYNQKRDTLKM